MLLPMVDLIEQAQSAVDEFIDVLGRAALEAVLELSAAQVAGPPHQGQVGGAGRGRGAAARPRSRSVTSCARTGDRNCMDR